ncbi:hypothetical protein H634G_03227 [Metarhizium anisopliae BRIP 53293]|uniref:Riboflavin kinase n=1 Tax=Metarhizium anisopliae BRIP 53293 TaxID=1291518 RepID=A0A0D9P6X1_METAN|nr:hypothetical protein H634G_03227 [Metarhizium anisopliae BRIP 53293]KJK93991.1 hypothetical protein H633G_02158 [Metarhizium anisopliae BRIP 53284]
MATTGRPSIVGPDSGPSAPYPYKMEGKVISGFGRGSKELGIPTANLPVDSALTPWISSIPSGVYFGYAAEVHVLHGFTADFYDAHMRLLILGFIREEKDYKSLEALIDDINFDCEVAKSSLARQAWKAESVGDGAEYLLKKL